MVEKKDAKVERESVCSITIHEPTAKDNELLEQMEDQEYEMNGTISDDWQNFKFDTHTGKEDCKKGEYDVIHIRSKENPDIEVSIHVIGGKLSIFSRYCDMKETKYHNEFELEVTKPSSVSS